MTMMTTAIQMMMTIATPKSNVWRAVPMSCGDGFFCVREQAQLAPEVLADTGQHGLVLMF